MAIYINYGEGEDDATVQGAEWLKNMIAHQSGPEAEQEFAGKFQELDKEDHPAVFKLFIDHTEELFNAIPESHGDSRIKEVESFFSLILSMLRSFENVSDLEESTNHLCQLLSESTEQQPELRLRVLMMLYNTFLDPSVEYRYRVFKAVLDYSAKAGMFDQVLPYLEYLDAWIVDWEPFFGENDKRNLFKDISTYLRELGKKLDAFLYLKRYHQLFQGASAKELNSEELQKVSLQLLQDAVQLPSVMQFDDILAMDSIKALQKTKHSDLVALCGVFLSGGVNDLRDFHKKHEKLFTEHGLSLQDCMSKIRLLSLAALVHGKSEMPLAEVAKALEESEDNVETWVVKALSEGVIDGRIDQLNHKVLVKSSFQRKFEHEEWAFLDSKLSQWIDNLESVIRFIGQQKQQSGAS